MTDEQAIQNVTAPTYKAPTDEEIAKMNQEAKEAGRKYQIREAAIQIYSGYVSKGLHESALLALIPHCLKHATFIVDELDKLA